MKFSVAIPFVALVLSSFQPSCASSHARQQSPPKEPVSTTSVTSSALTVETPSAQPAAPIRDPEKAAPNVPATGESEADRLLSEKVRQHLAKKPELADVGWNRVRIVTVDGNVTLVGELPTTADAIEIEHAVREVKGVKGVTNDIHLPEGTE